MTPVPQEIYLLKFFQYEHLPEKLQKISKPYCRLAIEMGCDLPDGPEKIMALRKLLESKDCAVRAYMEVDE